ncbi:MAG TPA: hypothetical protein VG476_10170 [Acidimicrobiales bacterium]|nr:hypothetical protein [Acidimicrobiales bacterium]
MSTERTTTIASRSTRTEADQPRSVPDGRSRPALPEDLVDPAQFWRWAARSLGKTSRPVVGWVLTGVGLLAIFLGWFGLSGQALVAKQLPFLISGGIGGIALVAIGAVILGTEDLRKDSGRLDRLEKQIAQLHAVLLARADAPEVSLAEAEQESARHPNGKHDRDLYGPGDDDAELVALPGAATFHRVGCNMVEGKPELEVISEDVVRDEGLKPCRLCDPVLPGT